MWLKIYKDLKESEIKNKLLDFKIKIDPSNKYLYTMFPSLNSENLFYQDGDDIQVYHDQYTTFYSNEFVSWAKENKIEVLHYVRNDYVECVYSPDRDLSLYLTYLEKDDCSEKEIVDLLGLETFNHFKSQNVSDLEKQLQDKLNASLYFSVWFSK